MGTEESRIDAWAYKVNGSSCARAMDGCGSTCPHCRAEYFELHEPAEIEVELGGANE